MKKIAIIVGHNAKYQGAMGNLGVSEYVLNTAIANILSIAFKDSEYKIKVFHRLPIKSYTKQMNDLAKRVNKFNPDVALSLHFNAGASKPKGHEVLYLHNSTKGLNYAKILDSEFDKYLPNKDRNLKPIYSKNERGGQLFYKIKAPVILAEPFFANEQNEIINENFNNLINAYKGFIEKV